MKYNASYNLTPNDIRFKGLSPGGSQNETASQRFQRITHDAKDIIKEFIYKTQDPLIVNNIELRYHKYIPGIKGKFTFGPFPIWTLRVKTLVQSKNSYLCRS